MKKYKKNTKKARYNGYNVFGDRCIAKFVTLEKDTAIKQYLDILDDIDAHASENLEYTFTLSKDFSEEESKALYRDIDRITALRAMMKKKSLTHLDLKTPSRVQATVW